MLEGSSKLSPEESRLKESKKLEKDYDEELSQIATRYNVEFDNDKETLSINLALKGQEALTKGQIKTAEEICNVLYSLASKWKDDFTKMKTLLLNAQIANYKGESQLEYLENALSLAKKIKILDIEIGIRVQLAFDYYKRRNYKKVLKEIKKIQKHPEFFSENATIVLELQSRTYWETDEYIKGFDSTLKWFDVLKDSLQDVHSIFLAIVYLLTVMNSLDLPFAKEKFDEIKNNISSILIQLGSAPHLFSEILNNIDVLFAKSLMLVEPEILYQFADLLLQSSRWNDEEKYLFLCQKLSDAFYNINDYEKAQNLMEKAYQFAKEKKYSEIEPLIKNKITEISSLIFYFMSFNPLFDPFSAKSITINTDDLKKKSYLQVISPITNNFPTTSYSQFLRIIEKASYSYIHEKSLKIEGFTVEEERCFFVLDLEIENERIMLLMKEDFKVDPEEYQTLHSTLSPYYSVIGLLSSERKSTMNEIDDIEEVLLKVQRAINCPASKAIIYLPEKNPQLNLFRFYLQEGGFRDLKVKILDSVLKLKSAFNFLKIPDILQIFQADPITIFDLSLRDVDNLNPLSKLITHAYGVNVSSETIHDFFQALIEDFLKRSDTRFWKDFYYQYAWLQTKGIYLSLSNEFLEKKKALNDKLVVFANKLGEKEKILESLYYRTFMGLVAKSHNFTQDFEVLKSRLNDYKSRKFSVISKLIQIFKDEDLDEEYNLVETLNLLCELCEFKDWDILLELFIYLLGELQEIKPLFEICKERDVKDSGIYLYLHLIKHLIEIERHYSSIELLSWILKTINSRKKNFHFSKHIWDYLFVTANMYMYSLASEVSDETLKKFSVDKNDVIRSLLDKKEWITDPLFIVELLNDYILILLDESNFSKAEKHYRWVEQLMFYYWDIFTNENNKDLLKNVNEIKKRIESQHFI